MFDFQPRLEEGLATLGLEASVDQVDQLMRFAGLLQKWNKVYNLTAIRRDDEILTHHLLDSAALVPFVKRLGPDAVNVLDVGSGGGLPSIPLAILTPDLRVTAVDAVSKKTAFLTQAAIELGLRNYSTRHARIERLSGQYDLITSRAFANLQDFVDLTRHLIKPDGLWLAMKGAVPEDEISCLPADASVAEVLPMEVPGLGEARHLVVMKPVN